MAKEEITIKDAEKELIELQSILKSVESKIRDTGGPKSQSWLFHTRHNVYQLEKKLEDLKANRTRTDKVPIEGKELEKRITSLENSLGKTKGEA